MTSALVTLFLIQTFVTVTFVRFFEMGEIVSNVRHCNICPLFLRWVKLFQTFVTVTFVRFFDR